MSAKVSSSAKTQKEKMKMVDGESLRKNLAANLRRLIEEKGINRYNLALALGVSADTVGYLYKGTRMPGLDLVAKVAAYFNVSIDDLVGFKSGRKPRKVA